MPGWRLTNAVVGGESCESGTCFCHQLGINHAVNSGQIIAGRRASIQRLAWNLNECMIAISGQSVPIFIQVVWSFLISARILMRRLDSRRSRLRALPFVSERRNISMTC